MKTKDFLEECSYFVRADEEWMLSTSPDMADVWDAMISQKKYEALLRTMQGIQRRNESPELFTPVEKITRKVLLGICCRFVRETPLPSGGVFWDLLVREKSRRVVETAERVATGWETEERLLDALENAQGCWLYFIGSEQSKTAAYVACWAGAGKILNTSHEIVYSLGSTGQRPAKNVHIRILADLGNPFKKGD